MPLVLRPPTDLAAPLRDRLGQLAASRKRVTVTAGVFRVIAVVVASVLVACLLDVAVHLPGVVRAAGLVSILAAGVTCYIRWVRQPATAAASAFSMAVLLEDKFPRLNDALASAVEFLAGGVPTSRFRAIAITRAENMVGRYDLDTVVPTGTAWRAFWLTVLLIGVVVPLGVFDSSRARLAVTRLVDPFGKHPWPTKTTIEILEPSFPARMAKGDPFTLRFVVRGVIPEQAILTVRLTGSPTHEEPIPLTVSETEPNRLTVEVRLDAGRVPRDFAVQLSANDFTSEWLPVVVAPPPKLIPRDDRPSPQMRLTYPAYTDLPPVELPDGTGVVEAVAGTVFHFKAATDLRIASAAFVPQADLTSVRTATAAAALGSTNPFGAAAAQLLADHALADIPVRIAGSDGTLLDADFIPHLPGLYALRFTDETGLTGVRLFDFRVFPDPAPVVLLTRPFPGRDPLTFVPTAVVPVAVRAEDRPFAVKSLLLEYRVNNSDAILRVMPLVDLDETSRYLPAVVGGWATLPSKPVGLDGRRAVPITAFRKPDGSSPIDGDIITLRAAAYDWDDYTALKAPGRSREVELRVLGRSSLEAEFQKDLAALRPDLLRLKEDQRAAREKTDEVRESAKNGKLTPEDAGKLGQVEQTQRQIWNKVADPADGLRAKAERLRETAAANGLPRSPTTDKLGAVADELGRLADRHLDAVEPPLSASKLESEKPTPDPKKVGDQLTKAEKLQRVAEASLANLLERLEEWGGAGEIRGEARALKDQLQRAGEQANQAAGKVPDGKPADKLTPAEKADLTPPADKLDRVGEQARDLLNKADRLADQKEKTAAAAAAQAAAKRAEAKQAAAEAAAAPKGSPEAQAKADQADAANAEADALAKAAAKAQAEADALRKAVQQAGGQALPDDAKKAAETLRKNQPSESATNRQSAADRLDKLADSLAEKPEPDGDELKKKKQSKLGDEIDKLAVEQDELRKKAKAAAAEPDADKRAEELKKLAREQAKLEEKAEQLAEKLTRDRADKAADAVRRAGEEMNAAKANLEQGESPTEKQDEALDRLDDALKKIEQEQKDEKEQLTREKREQLAEQLKAIRDRQAAAIAEVNRLHDAATKAKRWDRPLIVSLGDVEDLEKSLADDVLRFAEKEMTDLPVFKKLAEQSATAMTRAAKGVGERKEDALTADKFDAESEWAATDRLLRPMTTALRRLDQILGSLTDDPKAAGGAKPMAGAGGAGEPGGAGGGGEPPMGGNGVPPLAQLKALRALQAEVNDRTAAFAKDHPDPTKLNDDDKDDLKELEAAQRDVAELFEKLAPLFQKTPAPEMP